MTFGKKFKTSFERYGWYYHLKFYEGFFLSRKSDINTVNAGSFGTISCIYTKDNGSCGLWHILNWT